MLNDDSSDSDDPFNNGSDVEERKFVSRGPGGEREMWTVRTQRLDEP